MTIYTNTNKVAEFIFSLVDVNVEVEPFRKWPTYADVFIFDERFQDLISDYNQVLHIFFFFFFFFSVYIL